MTSRACKAARRASGRSCSKPMSRYEVKPVSSQKTNSAITLSASDEAEHRSHEGKQRDLEFPRVSVSSEIVRGIEDNQRAHGRDQGREQHAQAVEMKRE